MTAESGTIREEEACNAILGEPEEKPSGSTSRHGVRELPRSGMVADLHGGHPAITHGGRDTHGG